MISNRAGLRILAILAAAFAAASAWAATNISPPPEKFAQSPGGVDMRSGRYMYNQTDLSIGSGTGGLSLSRTMTQQVFGHISPFANFSHDWDVMVVQKRINITQGIYTDTPGQPDFQVEFAFGGRSHTYRAYGPTGTFDNTSRSGYALITYSAPGGDRSNPATVYTLQTSDGTTAVFRPIGSADCNAGLCAFVSQITNADGTSLSFAYDATGGANTSRLRSITSNRGYALVFEYSGMYVSKACVLNLTTTTKPATNICPAGVPTATYLYNTAGGETRLASVTDPSGAVSNFINTAGSIGFVKPGQSAPWLTNNFTSRMNDDGIVEQIVNSQSFADGQSYSYSFDQAPFVAEGHIPALAGGVFSDARGQITTVRYDFPLMPHATQGFGVILCGCPSDPPGGSVLVYQTTPGPVQVTDPLGQTTSTDYCDPNAEANLPPDQHDRCIVLPAAVSTTDPRGITTVLTWDFQSRNLLQTRRVAVAGSGLADIVESASYNCIPATMRYCNKPGAVTDANGKTTLLTYDPAHGGVLTETDPAVSGVTPQKRYSYAQRYAWISNGAGGYVHAASPVWVPTQMSFCKTGNPNSTNSGCAIAGDEVITTYDYAPDSGPNNLHLRGTLVDSGGLSLRTCVAYDSVGNKISETKPRAGLASCP